ncbi:ferritin-like domain-containing protein [Rhizomicrobium electricum]|uniref:Ferritin-like domain-containing protein n=1 Tax=Rhizomicrobium electricum TaxID=480070 RepID=A0ABP3QBS4_9PROT|nr:ferritin-like domain-containing protein [Rhizomicrobium electricum]NIJ50553.1 hypothetical protein [Rhizomicrobium electricum]
MTLALPNLRFDPIDVPEGPVRLGSPEHLRLLCKTLLETFNPYKPAVIDWPKLDAKTQDLITSLPIWDIAVQTENRAGVWVGSYADKARDPLLRQAVELNAFEERRHRHVLANLVEAYGIALKPEPAYPAPRDPEWAFVQVGFSECIDSFFAFGLFEAARRTGFFPPELVDTFEPVIAEEGRHILFFVNWLAWHRRTMPAWRRPWFELKVAVIWAYLILERIGIASNIGEGDKQSNFTVNGADQLGVDITPAALMDLCLAENDRRLGVYDNRLLRPTLVPAMVRLIRRFLPEPQKR